jgi:hypothetical protein
MNVMNRKKLTVYFCKYDLRKHAKTEEHEKSAGTVQIKRKVSSHIITIKPQV